MDEDRLKELFRIVLNMQAYHCVDCMFETAADPVDAWAQETAAKLAAVVKENGVFL